MPEGADQELRNEKRVDSALVDETVSNTLDGAEPLDSRIVAETVSVVFSLLKYAGSNDEDVQGSLDHALDLDASTAMNNEQLNELSNLDRTVLFYRFGIKSLLDKAEDQLGEFEDKIYDYCERIGACHIEKEEVYSFLPVSSNLGGIVAKIAVKPGSSVDDLVVDKDRLEIKSDSVVVQDGEVYVRPVEEVPILEATKRIKVGNSYTITRSNGEKVRVRIRVKAEGLWTKVFKVMTNVSGEFSDLIAGRVEDDTYQAECELAALFGLKLEDNFRDNPREDGYNINHYAGRPFNGILFEMQAGSREDFAKVVPHHVYKRDRFSKLVAETMANHPENAEMVDDMVHILGRLYDIDMIGNLGKEKKVYIPGEDEQYVVEQGADALSNPEYTPAVLQSVVETLKKAKKAGMTPADLMALIEETKNIGVEEASMEEWFDSDSYNEIGPEYEKEQLGPGAYAIPDLE